MKKTKRTAWTPSTCKVCGKKFSKNSGLKNKKSKWCSMECFNIDSERVNREFREYLRGLFGHILEKEQ